MSIVRHTYGERGKREREREREREMEREREVGHTRGIAYMIVLIYLSYKPALMSREGSREEREERKRERERERGAGRDDFTTGTFIVLIYLSD